MAIFTGANFIYNIGLESSYAGSVSTWYGVLGWGSKISTFSIKNQFEGVYQLNSQYYQGYYSKGESVDVTIDFYLCGDNKNWINLVLNATTSAQLQIQTGEGTVYTIPGIRFNQAKISVKTGDLVSVSLTGVGQTMTVGTVMASTPTIPTDVYTFKDVTVAGNIPTDLDITIDNQSEMIYKLGSVMYAGFAMKGYKVSVDLTMYHDATTQLVSLLTANSPSPGTQTITIGNYTITISDIIANEGAMTVEPVTPVQDKISYIASNISIS